MVQSTVLIKYLETHSYNTGSADGLLGGVVGSETTASSRCSDCDSPGAYRARAHSNILSVLVPRWAAGVSEVLRRCGEVGFLEPESGGV